MVETLRIRLLTLGGCGMGPVSVASILVLFGLCALVALRLRQWIEALEGSEPVGPFGLVSLLSAPISLFVFLGFIVVPVASCLDGGFPRFVAGRGQWALHMGFLAVVPLVLTALFFRLGWPRGDRFSALHQHRGRMCAFLMLGSVSLVTVVLGTAAATELRSLSLAALAIVVWMSTLFARNAVLGIRSQRLSGGEFLARVVSMAKESDITLRDVHLFDSKAAPLANAFAMQGNRLGVSLEVLRSLSRKEVEFVMEHELAHLRLKHTSTLSWFSVLGIFFVFMLPSFPEPLPAAATLSGGLLLLGLLRNHVQWRLEFAADQDALRHVPDPTVALPALRKLHSISGLTESWPPAFGVLMSHPPLVRRCERLGGEVVPSNEEGFPLPTWSAASKVVLGGGGGILRLMAASLGGWLFSFLLPFGAFLGLEFAARAHSLPQLVSFSLGMGVVVMAELATIGLADGLHRRLLLRALPDRKGRMAVGVAPAAAFRFFNGLLFSDVGWLGERDGALEFEGEQCHFRLPWNCVTQISCTGLPGGGIGSRLVCVQYCTDQGETRRIAVHPLAGPWPWTIGRVARQLADVLEERRRQAMCRASGVPLDTMDYATGATPAQSGQATSLCFGAAFRFGILYLAMKTLLGGTRNWLLTLGFVLWTLGCFLWRFARLHRARYPWPESEPAEAPRKIA